MRRVVYLAGGISGLSYEQASSKRTLATELLTARDWDVLDPLRGKEVLSSLDTIDESRAMTLLGTTASAITQRDRDDIRRADVVLVLTGDTPSWGTAFEWEFAYSLGKPIVVVASEDAPCRVHPWCQVMTSYFAGTVEEAVEFISTWLDRKYRLS